MTRLPMTVARAAVLTVGFLVTLPAILALAAWEWWQVWQRGLLPDPPNVRAPFTDWAQVMRQRAEERR